MNDLLDEIHGGPGSEAALRLSRSALGSLAASAAIAAADLDRKAVHLLFRETADRTREATLAASYIPIRGAIRLALQEAP